MVQYSVVILSAYLSHQTVARYSDTNTFMGRGGLKSEPDFKDTHLNTNNRFHFLIVVFVPTKNSYIDPLNTDNGHFSVTLVPNALSFRDNHALRPV